MEIHRTLGLGLKEVNYKDAMEIDFVENGFQFQREKRFLVVYKGKQLRHPYIADFVINNEIILEIKSSVSIAETHLAQALSYLAVAGLKLAIVINFGEKSLSWKRVLL
jgi:GxxExxY protein